jgi:hypothetical protein
MKSTLLNAFVNAAKRFSTPFNIQPSTPPDASQDERK